MNFERILRDAGVIVATTIGAGIFALPYIFLQSGFWLSAFYLLLLSLIIIFAHILYWRVLDVAGEHRRFLGLAKTYLGSIGYLFAIVAVLVGLLLTLVIYLILGTRLLQTFLPSLGENYRLILFWAFAALPLLFKERKILLLENLGSLGIAAIIIFIFAGNGFSKLPVTPAVSFTSLLLPFGVLLFSLAGWTAIEPLYASRKNKKSQASSWKLLLILGTLFSGILYVMFVLGIFAGASTVTPDTISGFLGLAGPEKFVLALLGIFAIWTSYEPIGLEIKNALSRDLRWRQPLGLAFIVFLPLILILIGLNNFLKVIGLAGGVFLSLQYLLILFISRCALRLSRIQTFILSLSSLVFILGMIYEVYYFMLG